MSRASESVELPEKIERAIDNYRDVLLGYRAMGPSHADAREALQRRIRAEILTPEVNDMLLSLKQRTREWLEGSGTPNWSKAFDLLYDWNEAFTEPRE